MALGRGEEPGQDHHGDEPGVLLLTADLAGYGTGESVEVRGSFRECSSDGSIGAYFLVVDSGVAGAAAWCGVIGGGRPYREAWEG
jgi:hypothetical protein